MILSSCFRRNLVIHDALLLHATPLSFGLVPRKFQKEGKTGSTRIQPWASAERRK